MATTEDRPLRALRATSLLAPLAALFALGCFSEFNYENLACGDNDYCPHELVCCAGICAKTCDDAGSTDTAQTDGATDASSP